MELTLVDFHGCVHLAFSSQQESHISVIAYTV